MKPSATYLLSTVGLIAALGGASVIGQSEKPGVEAHLAAAKAAAGQEHASMLNLCRAPSAPLSAARRPAVAQPEGPPDRSQWHVEPVKVFDNLYFVGQAERAGWALTTSGGIIIVDAIFDYAVEEQIVNGLTKLGLDPKQIKYVIVMHGHSDHAGGARYLQDRFGARVIASAADWDLLDRNTEAWPKPKRDIVASDGHRLTLGDTTLTLYLTPGHTPGVISTLIPVRDGGRPHMAAILGGTGPEPDKSSLAAYVKSIGRFRDLVTKAGAGVLIANHTDRDGSKTKLPAMAKRKPGDPHPYVIGNDSVRRYFTVALECAQANLLRLQ